MLRDIHENLAVTMSVAFKEEEDVGLGLVRRQLIQAPWMRAVQAWDAAREAIHPWVIL